MVLALAATYARWSSRLRSSDEHGSHEPRAPRWRVDRRRARLDLARLARRTARHRLSRERARRAVSPARMIAPPLLLRGTRCRVALPRCSSGRRRCANDHCVTKPLLAMVGVHVVMLATHTPGVVDLARCARSWAPSCSTWRGSSRGSLLVAGRDRRCRSARTSARQCECSISSPERRRISISRCGSCSPTFPAYGIYELAPRVTGLSALEDQQVAGGLLLRSVGRTCSR